MVGLWTWRRSRKERALEEASEWIAAVRSNPESSRVAFARWLRKDARNVDAFLTLNALDQDLPRLLTRWPAATRSATPLWLRPRALLAACACIVLAVIALYPFAAGPQAEFREYVTDVGAPHELVLADGSVVHLNTRSRLDFRVTRKARDLHLLAGEAFFIVAKDRSRPFRVHTDAAVVQAIGTRFNVDTHEGGTVVAVVEGSVQLLLPGTTGSREITRFMPLRAGESMEIQRTGGGADLHVTTLTPQALDRRTAWISGVLSFEDEPLTNVVAQMNRYNRRQMVIVDPTIAQVSVGGRFKATDVETFLMGLQQIASVEVEPSAAGTEPLRLRARHRAGASL